VEARVSTPTRTGPQPVTMSVGVATGRPGDLSSEDLVMAADAAVYRAKELGRNRVVADAPAGADPPLDRSDRA
jgi:diguanylate cyclase (GGDEF)-like protein